VKKTLTHPLPFAAPSPALLLRVLLAGELLFSLALQARGVLPPVAVHALQLFLRF
jgi:hypothetical protein